MDLMRFFNFSKKAQGEETIAETNRALIYGESLRNNHSRLSSKKVDEGVHYLGPMILKHGIKGTTEFWRLYGYGENNCKLQKLVDLAEIAKITRIYPTVIQAKLDRMPLFDKKHNITHVTIGSKDISFIDTLDSVYKKEVDGYRRCSKK